MIEDIFLTYVNYPLNDYPEILHTIFKQYNDLNIYIDDLAQDAITNIINHFVDFSKYTTRKDANELRKQKILKNPNEERFIEIAFEGIYGFRDAYCDGICSMGDERRAVIDKRYFTGSQRIKCYECDQLYFKNIIYEIVKGEKYGEVAKGGLATLIANAHLSIERTIGISILPQLPFKEKLVEEIFFNPSACIYRDIHQDYPYKENFSGLFLWRIVAYSLTEFLFQDDRGKLKKCQWCGKYFVANKADKRIKFCQICSPKCKLAREEKTELQRKRRAKEKELKILQIRKAQIERFLEAGFTEEEAEKEWEVYKRENKL